MRATREVPTHECWSSVQGQPKRNAAIFHCQIRQNVTIPQHRPTSWRLHFKTAQKNATRSSHTHLLSFESVRILMCTHPLSWARALSQLPGSGKISQQLTSPNQNRDWHQTKNASHSNLAITNPRSICKVPRSESRTSNEELSHFLSRSLARCFSNNHSRSRGLAMASNWWAEEDVPMTGPHHRKHATPISVNFFYS